MTCPPDGPASAVIAAEIARRGPIPFRDFMALALYHPDVGYYCRDEPRIGPEGDYYTSPDVHPEFGACLGRQFADCWRLLGAPTAFDLVELGGGKGLLARDVLRWAAGQAPGFAAAIRYTSVELSPAMRARQARRLSAGEIGSDLASRVRWLDADELAPGSIVGCVLAHEFFDALPIHRVVGGGHGWREVYVGLDAAGGPPRFAESLGPVSNTRLADWLARSSYDPEPGRRLDVALEAPVLLGRLSTWLRRGYLVAIDYGRPVGDFDVPRSRAGTVRAFRRHALSDDPYVEPGDWDLTCDVDFAALARAGLDARLKVAGYTRQAEFLGALGIGDRLAAALADPATSLADFRTERRAVEALVHPAGLGGFRVLSLARCAPTDGLTGFAWRDDRALLPREATTTP